MLKQSLVTISQVVVRTRIVLLLTIVFMLLGDAKSSKAFKTDDTGHPTITRNALQDKKLERESEGDKLTFSDKAIEDIIGANLAVDGWSVVGFFPGSASWHFDDENLEAGSKRLVDLRKEIIDAIKVTSPDGDLARTKLGRALHTLQDFYAHSNWVELNASGKISDINFGHAILSDPPALAAPCPDRLHPDRLGGVGVETLTTGYFPYLVSWFGSTWNVLGKCAHGTPLLPGIAKDTGFLHDLAFNAAQAATVRFVDDILNDGEIAGNPKAIKALMGRSGSLTIVIDITGSMAEEIAGVKSTVQDMIADAKAQKEPPEEYTLVTFGDPMSQGEIFVSANPDSFLAHVNGLTVADGGDCPEYSQTGVLDAIYASKIGSNIYVFTDATSKDGDKAGSIDTAAQKKQSAVHYHLSGSCSPIDSSYISVAKKTGGQLFLIEPKEIAASFELIRPSLASDFVKVMLTNGSLLNSTQPFTVPIDSTMSQAMFAIALDNKTSFTLKRPSGALITPTEPGVTVTNLSSGWVITIDEPEAGNWQLQINGNGNFSVAVNGRSALDFFNFAFLKLVQGRHEELLPLDGQPLIGTQQIVSAKLAGPFNSADFRLLSENGDLIKTIHLTADPVKSANIFSGTFDLPATPFRVAVNGLDGDGKLYQRTFPTLFQAQTIEVVGKITPSADTPNFFPGKTTAVAFTVRNLGQEATFDMKVTNSAGDVAVVEPTQLTLATGATGTVEVDLAIPLAMNRETVVSAIASVQSISDSNIVNSASIEVNVDPLRRLYLPIVKAAKSSNPLILFDDFSTLKGGWYTEDRTSVKWSYQVGEYEMLLRQPDNWIGVVNYNIFKDFSLGVDLHRRSGNASFAGLIFGFSNWDKHYLFVVDSSQQAYSVWQRDTATSPSLISIIPWTADTHINLLSLTNHLQLERTAISAGYTNRIYVNNAFLTSFNTQGSGSGIGLYAETPNDGSVPTALRFDNFQVTAISATDLFDAREMSSEFLSPLQSTCSSLSDSTLCSQIIR